MVLLIKLPSFSRASLNGTIRAGTRMGPSEEELEEELPLREREEEVFLFISKKKKQNYRKKNKSIRSKEGKRVAEQVSLKIKVCRRE